MSLDEIIAASESLRDPLLKISHDLDAAKSKIAVGDPAYITAARLQRITHDMHCAMPNYNGHADA
jgi:hypothetical protein